MIVLGGYLLHFTVFGRYVYAIGGNRDAAEYSGINVNKVETSTYVISAGLAGVAGVCYAAYIGQMSQQVGIAYELYAIAAVVLGGCSLRGGEGTVLGIVIGSAMMRVIDNGINMFQLRYHDADGIPRLWRLNPNWTFIIVGAVILIAVILDQVVHIVQSARRVRHGAGQTPLASGGPPAARRASSGGAGDGAFPLKVAARGMPARGRIDLAIVENLSATTPVFRCGRNRLICAHADCAPHSPLFELCRALRRRVPGCRSAPL